MNPRRRWTAEEDAQLHALYPSAMPMDEIADALHRTVPAIRFRAVRNGLRRPMPTAEQINRLVRSGSSTRFAKGEKPWNKGWRHVSGGRSVETQFKAGGMPHNTKPIDSLRVAMGVLQRKIAMHGKNASERWRAEHELVWIAAHGPVPEGHIVRFREGMATTVAEQITIERLECVSRAEHMHRNSVQRLPAELRQVIQLRGVLQRRIRTREENQ